MNLEDFGDTLEESGVCGKEEFWRSAIPLNLTEDYTFLSQITNSDERYYRLRAICSRTPMISIRTAIRRR